MMPGIGFEEMVIFALLAIVVIGPKDLPLRMRKFGRFTGKMRAMAFEFKQGFDELGRQAELDELRREVANLKKHTGLDDLQKEFRDSEAGLQGEVRSALAGAEASASPALPGAGLTQAAVSYAGLSADHPGYDAGEDFRIDGAPVRGPAPGDAPEPGLADTAGSAGPAPATGGSEVDGVHVVPDDEVRPISDGQQPTKQDATL
jgi:sec-independent protein translocase protein TatB